MRSYTLLIAPQIVYFRFHLLFAYVLSVHILFLAKSLVPKVNVSVIVSILLFFCSSSFDVPDLVLSFLFLTYPTFVVLYCSFFMNL